MSTGPGSPEPPQQPPSPRRQQQQPPPPPQGYQPPYVPGQGYPPPGYQVQRGPGAPMRPDEERLWAIAAHLGPLVVGLVAPLVVWLVFKDRSAFLDRTGKEALNMQISFLIYGTVAGFSILLLVGLLLLPVVVVTWLVLMIVATIRVSRLEDYRYPLILRLVS